MPKVIPHRKLRKPPKRKRYVIERNWNGMWKKFAEHNVLWVAKINIRSWEDAGRFEYRLVDMLGEE